MQSSYTLPRPQPMRVTMGVSLLAAALIGGAGGYALKGVTGVSVASHPAHAATGAAHAATGAARAVPAGIYEQGGRPWSVYDAAAGRSPSVGLTKPQSRTGD